MSGEAEVVEHKALLRELPHELHRGWHMPRKYQQVVREAERPEGGDTSLEVVAQQEIVVGLVDDDMTKALKLGVDRQGLEPRSHIWGRKGRPSPQSL